MSILSVENLTHSFGEKILYQNASLELFKGEHMGIVGQNGTGKSTLINIFTGTIMPDKGKIEWQKNATIGHLDQYAELPENYTIFEYLKTAFARLYEIEEKLNQLYMSLSDNIDEQISKRISNYQEQLIQHDFYSIDSMVSKVAAGLGLTAIGLDRPLEKLSGGQREKVILAKLLLEKPDVLLLDEPTNFLDKEHISWLEEYLQGFEGCVIVISHDFEFLNNVTTCICDIEFCNINKYNGKYEQFVRQKEERREQYVKNYNSQQKEIAKLEEFVSRNIARASTSGMAKSRQKQLDKMDVIAPPTGAPKPHFNFPEIPLSTPVTLRVKQLEVGYYYPLLPKIDFSMGCGEKIAITGFNGIGKSTLLKTLISKIEKLSGEFVFAPMVKIGYFEQELNWENDEMTPMQYLREEFPLLSDKEFRKCLASCGLKSKLAMQPLKSLSGGEQTKVKLCVLTMVKCNFLVLDEPTNHLDVDAKDELKRAIIAFKGNAIIVSHEPPFYKDLVNKVIDIEKLFKK